MKSYCDIFRQHEARFYQKTKSHVPVIFAWSHPEVYRDIVYPYQKNVSEYREIVKMLLDLEVRSGIYDT